MEASVVTLKGQVVIPKPIRDHFDIRTFTKMVFEVVGDNIIVKPTPTISQMAGFIKSKKHFTQEDYDRAIGEAIVKEFKGK